MVPEGPVTAHAFVDYSAYILKRPSTPTAGIKAGCMMAVGVLGDQNPFEDFGKSSWAFSKDLGMHLSIGATILVNSQWTAAVMPKLSVGFEF